MYLCIYLMVKNKDKEKKVVKIVVLFLKTKEKINLLFINTVWFVCLSSCYKIEVNWFNLWLFPRTHFTIGNRSIYVYTIDLTIQEMTNTCVNMCNLIMATKYMLIHTHKHAVSLWKHRTHSIAYGPMEMLMHFIC